MNPAQDEVILHVYSYYTCLLMLYMFTHAIHVYSCYTCLLMLYIFTHAIHVYSCYTCLLMLYTFTHTTYGMLFPHTVNVW